MNIIVCVKQVHATYARTGMAPDAHFLNPEDSIKRINPYDEAAMAMAVKIRETAPDTHITVVTLGPMTAEENVWRIMGMGGDRLCRVELAGTDAQAQALDSWAKAQILAQTAKNLQADLVLCGKESIDLQNGLVATFMAHLLDLPFAAAILDLQLKKDAGGRYCARITKNAGKGRREIMDSRLPALFSVEVSPGPLPMPAFAAIQQARRKEVARMVFDPGALFTKTRNLKIAAPRPRPKPVPAPDSHLPGYERVKLLLAGSAIQKTGKIVTGEPETQVDEILAFMEAHGLLPWESPPASPTSDD